MSSKRRSSKLSRKEFRKLKRKLKKKSKRLAKQFDKQHNHGKEYYYNSQKSKLKSSFIKNSMLKNQNHKKKNKKQRKKVRFAEELNEIFIIGGKEEEIFKENQRRKEQIKNNWSMSNDSNIKMDGHDIMNSDERWIKKLERKLGFKKERKINYWKTQEFTQDGLDCFFDLGYLSNESELDEEDAKAFQSYFEGKQINADTQPMIKDTTSSNTMMTDDVKLFLMEENGEIDCKTIKNKKYLPPQLRKLREIPAKELKNTQIEERLKLQMIKTKKVIKSHLNRLSVKNLHLIATLIMDELKSNLNEKNISIILCECVFCMLNKSESPESLHVITICLAALVCIAYYLMTDSTTNEEIKDSKSCQSLIIEIFTNHIQNALTNKYKANCLENTMLFMSYLYLFGILDTRYMVQMLTVFVDQSNADNFHIIDQPMIVSGSRLRNENPMQFKIIVQAIINQSKVLLTDVPFKQELEIKKSLKIVSDIKDNIFVENKNNNIFKAFNSFLPILSRLKAQTTNELVLENVGFNDFINIGENGRWWLKSMDEIKKHNDGQSVIPDAILMMSKKFQMNSDVSRALFCIIMSADDYIDCFEKLIAHINQSSSSVIRELIKIIIHLCMRESDYNAYYYLLLGKLIKHERGWKFVVHCALWDKFLEIESLSATDVINLAKMIADLIVNKYLNLVVLKNNLEFMKATKNNVVFVHTLFENILLSIHTIEFVFSSLKLPALKNEIQTFFESILIPRAKQKIQRLKNDFIKDSERHSRREIGIQMRNAETFLVSIQNANEYMRDQQLQRSAFNRVLF